MSGATLGIKIESNFKDYYDKLGTDLNPIAVYNRHRSEEARGSLLGQLRNMGIKTIELKAARDCDNTVKKLVVYTNPRLHESKGKRIVRLDEARLMFSNNLASKYYEEANGVTLKFLQVGARRFRVTLKSDGQSLQEGNVTDIVELASELNFCIMHPIFSIDYITTGKEMIAIDFNKVQQLDKIGMESVLSPGEVITEIKRSIMAYNKI